MRKSTTPLGADYTASRLHKFASPSIFPIHVSRRVSFGLAAPDYGESGVKFGSCGLPISADSNDAAEPFCVDVGVSNFDFDPCSASTTSASPNASGRGSAGEMPSTTWTRPCARVVSSLLGGHQEAEVPRLLRLLPHFLVEPHAPILGGRGRFLAIIPSVMWLETYRSLASGKQLARCRRSVPSEDQSAERKSRVPQMALFSPMWNISKRPCDSPLLPKTRMTRPSGPGRSRLLRSRAR